MNEGAKPVFRGIASVLVIMTCLTGGIGFAQSESVATTSGRSISDAALPDYRVVLAGAVEVDDQGRLALAIVDGTRVRILVSGNLEKFTALDGKPVMIYGRMEGPSHGEPAIYPEKVKKLSSLKELEKIAQDIENGLYREDQLPAELCSSSDDIMVIDNFRWSFDPKAENGLGKADFRRTTIDISKVRKAMFVLEPFPPEAIAGHAMLFFELDQGGVTSLDGKAESRGLVLSIEAFLTREQKYGLMEGLKKKFRIVYQLGTLEDRTEISLNQRNHKLKPYELELTPTQTRTLLKAALDAACLDHSAEFYNTLVNNCTNNLIRLINMVVEPKRQVREWLIPRVLYNPRATVPVLVPDKMKKKGLIRSELPVLLPPAASETQE